MPGSTLSVPFALSLSFLAAATGSALAQPAEEAEDFSAWAYHGEVLLNTASAGVTADVADFPLLVRLTRAEFPFDQADGRGRDIRFSDPQGNSVPHQIDRWDSAAGLADVWVKVGLVKGNASDQVLHTHWGRPGSADRSSGSSVFETSKGFVSAWHLGGTGNRANAVSGGNPAVPVNFTGKESKAGIIGYADSLGWGSRGGYLDIGDGYNNLGGGLTFSAWIYPTAIGDYTHFIDIGNGEATDNLILQRRASTTDLEIVNFGGDGSLDWVRARSGLVQKEWQHLAVTVSGREAKLYRNGVLAATATLDVAVNSAWRTKNFLGRSNWDEDDNFQGKMDETWVSKLARHPQWIKLSYENQKPGQRVAAFRPSTLPCRVGLGTATALTVSEGSMATLEGVADCATRAWWTPVGGLPLRLMDPEAKRMQVQIPRVDRDTTVILEFSAQVGESVTKTTVEIRILNTIPEPEFTLPPYVIWNGLSPISVSPIISNLAAIKASSHPDLRWYWKLDPLMADTAWAPGAFVLKSSPAEGTLNLILCLDNQATPTCKTTEVRINRRVGILARNGRLAGGTGSEAPALPWRDALGRLGMPQAPGAKTAEGMGYREIGAAR